MNVTSVGTPPPAIPAPLPVQKPVAADRASDARQQAQQQATHQAAQQAKQPAKDPDREIKLPPLKPVSPQEFRVMLGALPVTALTQERPKRGSFDVYA